MKDLLDFRIIKVIINRRWVVFVFLVCLSRIIIDFVPSQTETRLTCEVFFPLLPGNGKSDNGKHKDVNRCCQRGAKNDVQTKNINVPLDEFFCFLLGLAVGKKKKSPNSASQVWLDLLRGGAGGSFPRKALASRPLQGEKSECRWKNNMEGITRLYFHSPCKQTQTSLLSVLFSTLLYNVYVI